MTAVYFKAIWTNCSLGHKNGRWNLMLKMQSNASRRAEYKMVLQHGG